MSEPTTTAATAVPAIAPGHVAVITGGASQINPPAFGSR